MPFVKIGEHRVLTEKLLGYYKNSAGWTLIYVFDNDFKYISIPNTEAVEQGIQFLDSVLKVENRT